MLLELFALTLPFVPGEAESPKASASVALAAPSGAHEPQLALDAERVFAVYGTEHTIELVISGDCAKSFGEPVVVAKVEELALGMHRGPRIACTKDAVVVTAIAGRKSAERAEELWSWRSSDHGAHWSEALHVNTVDRSAREGLHALAAGPDGRLFTSWIDFDEGNSVLRGSSSTDGGASWTKPVLIYRSPEGSICACCAPALAFDAKGTIGALWRNALDGARDPYLALSRDGGQSWSTAEKVGVGTWKLKSCPMDGGVLVAVEQAGFLCAWRRERSLVQMLGPRAELEFARGEGPSIACGPGGPWITWSEARAGRLLLHQPGAEQPLELDSSAIDGVLCAPLDGKGPVIAGWESGDGKLRVARVR